MRRIPQENLIFFFSVLHGNLKGKKKTNIFFAKSILRMPWRANITFKRLFLYNGKINVYDRILSYFLRSVAALQIFMHRV